MMAFQKSGRLVYFFAGCLLIAGFQNCSQVEFSPAEGVSLGKSEFDPDGSNGGGEHPPGENGENHDDGDGPSASLSKSCQRLGYITPSAVNLIDAEDIDSLVGKKIELEFRSIDSIGAIVGGSIHIYASERIGSIGSITGGAQSIVAKELGSLGAKTGGYLCIRAQKIDDLSRFTGGSAVFESVGVLGRIDSMPGTTGGVKIFRNYGIENVNSGTGGHLRIENSRIGTLTLGKGGVVELVNTHANRIVRSDSSTKLILKNSTYGALQ